jgi:guanine deaminase
VPASDANAPRRRAFRGPLLHFLADPGAAATPEAAPDAAAYFADGLLLVENGLVSAVGAARELQSRLDGSWELTSYPDKLILPGFVDCHTHYPQTDIVAAYGEHLLQWLERYTFPVEARFADPAHAGEVAEAFLDELLRNGTTTALVLATVHPQSVDAFFRAAAARRLRMVAGKVLMDRNAPDYLVDTPASGYADSRALIERWHGVGRLDYAITPRFAPTSTEAQLAQAGKLAAEYPGTYVHTHVAENRHEVAWVAELFPSSRSYLDVYDRFGLLRERAVYAHCLHLDTDDRRRMADSGAAMAFCPTSNLFLGSGLFDLAAADLAGVRVGLATDIGAGTSFGLLQTLGDAYKVLQLNGQSLSPLRAFYLATLGGARALYLDERIGNFSAGKDADFVVLDPAATPLLARRMQSVQDLAEQLFALMTLGDDRAVAATHVLGEPLHRRGEV